MNHLYHILLADNHAGFRREVRKILEEIPRHGHGRGRQSARIVRIVGKTHRRNW